MTPDKMSEGVGQNVHGTPDKMSDEDSSTKDKREPKGLDGKKPDIVDGMLHYAGKNTFHNAPANFKHLLGRMMVYHMDDFGFKFIKAEKSRWIKWAGEMVDTFGEDFMLDIIGEAVDYHKKQGLAYAGPWSLNFSIQKVAAGQVDNSGNESTLRPFTIIVE